MSENNHLPVFGVGPYLIAPMFAIAVLAIISSFYGIIPNYSINHINPILFVIGIVFIILGALFWILAVLNSRITENIEENKLVTTGIYAYVRHPIYAAFLYAIIGLICISANVALLILPIIYWIILTVAMKSTEEKWLLEKFGNDYSDYAKKVSRFFPFLRI